MITITFPEWFTWLLVVCIGLSAINSCLRTYIRHLEKELLKLTQDE